MSKLEDARRALSEFLADQRAEHGDIATDEIEAVEAALEAMDDLEAAKNVPAVVVTLRGGCVEVTQSNVPVRVVLIDWDNIADSGDKPCDVIKELIDQHFPREAMTDQSMTAFVGPVLL
jgi:hypothetical protein